MATNSSVYALNLFDIVDREEYLTYSRRSAREVAPHGGKLVAPGRFRETQKGDILSMTSRMLTRRMAVNLLEEVAVEEIRR